MPPCCAMAIAIRDSVTVSMAEESSGVFRVMSRVSCVCVLPAREPLAVGRNEQDVIEGEGFRYGALNHKCLR